MRLIRRSIPATERTRKAVLITGRLLCLPELRGASVVLAFCSFGSEVPTADLLGALQEAGVTTLLPYLSSGEMGVTEHHRGDRLVASSYGPLEPEVRRGAAVDSIDAVITPGLAFDDHGGRLGYGGGYYDRFLRGVPARASIIGIGFAEQVVGHVPVSGDDVTVDLVVTDREVIHCRPG
jgi:5-formyltetrahydrofolate cyclo-ligase